MTDTSKTPELPTQVDDLMEAASVQAGLDDFGDLQFTQGLQAVTRGFVEEARLSPMGQQLAFGGLLNMLVNRLRYVRDVKAHPEILEERIAGPIVVTGLPRTGTTKLQRVLSTSPDALGMDYWRMMNPAPFPDEEPGCPEGRIQAARDAVQMISTHFPGFVARHPTEAEVADEEVLLMQGSFQAVVTWLFARMPSFYAFCMEVDQRPLYDFLHSQMQYMQWQQGGAQGRHWVLKSPCHMGLLDTFMQVFPDARFVHCHRSVETCMPSMSGLTEEMRRVHSDHVERQVIGPEMLDYFGGMMDRYLEVRATQLEDRFLDVHYREVADDVSAVIERVYAHVGRTLPAGFLQQARQYSESRPKHYLGSYTYDAADYGLSDGAVRERFAAYRERFSQFE